MGRLIFEHTQKFSRNFHVSLNIQTGEPQIIGLISHEAKQSNNNQEVYSLVVDIPSSEISKVKEILNMVHSISMSDWIFYESNLPKEESFQWCQPTLKTAGFEWLLKPKGELTRIIFTNPNLKNKKEFNFVIFDLDEKKIYRCFGSY